MESPKMESSGSSSTSGNSVLSLSSKPQNFSAGKLRGGKRACFYGCGTYIKDSTEAMWDHCLNDCRGRFEIDNFENKYKSFVKTRFPDGKPVEVAYNQRSVEISAKKATHMTGREKFTQQWITQLKKLNLS